MRTVALSSWFRLLKSSNRFTAYSIHPIELKLGRMTLDLSPHNLAESEFLLPPKRWCGGAHLAIHNHHLNEIIEEIVKLHEI